MRKIKVVIFLLLIGCLSIVIYQNLHFFLAKNSLTVGWKLLDFSFQTPAISNIMFLLGCFVLGLLIAYLSLLKSMFKNKKNIKLLNKTILDNEKTISELKTQISISEKPVETLPATEDSVEEIKITE